MGFYRDLALPLAERGIPTIPLRPRTKIAFIPEWETLATTDIAQIELWDNQYPDANCASVAQGKLRGVWFFEADSPSVFQRIKKETGQSIPLTYTVRSSPGRGHVYFKQTKQSIETGNIAQGFVKEGDWSARIDRQYVVSEGSLHPKTGLPYEARSLAPIVEAPDWFVSWMISQKLDKKKTLVDYTEGEGIIPEHFRNDVLTSLGGGLRQKGLNYDEILPILNRINAERCVPNLPDSELETICASVSRYEPGKPDIILLGGKVLVDGKVTSEAPIPDSSPTITPQEMEDVVPIIPRSYPRFPEWVMRGTSIYTGLVEPFCSVNSRYPEMMFMPAIVLFLNYMGTKVRIKMKDDNLSIFMVLIGRAGRVIKSSCVQDAIKYFELMGCVGHGEQGANNANGRALVFTPASPEGLGKEMNRLNCKNGILFYDELSTLTNKASIESSTLTSVLLTLYESGKFQNIVKSVKDSYSLLPGSYCASLIACSTDKNFALNWSKLAGKSTGLNDRFFFLLQPQVLKDLTEHLHVPIMPEACAKTRQLIDKAIEKKVYCIVDTAPLNIFLRENQNNNRAYHRAEKFALYFAIDLGLDEVDEECIERGLALVEYEMKVKKYVRVYEAATKEGALQMEIMHHLENSGGIMPRRDLERSVHPERYGTSLWEKVYLGLIKQGWCEEQGKGTKGDPKRLIALRLPEDDD
ncbi:MAG: bifunctional DNA primase/polymerase [Thaumarchaeota archaeon]|nr:bifunctional DNA primase/polymerase [Nitrososphaerota archaeon]